MNDEKYSHSHDQGDHKNSGSCSTEEQACNPCSPTDSEKTVAVNEGAKADKTTLLNVQGMTAPMKLKLLNVF